MRSTHFILSLYLTFAPLCLARRGGGGSSSGGGSSGDLKINLNLDPLETAAFAVYIIFGVIFLFLLLLNSGVLRHNAATPKFPYRILLLANTFLVVDCGVSAALLPLKRTFNYGDPATQKLDALFTFLLYFPPIMVFAAIALTLRARAQKYLTSGSSLWQHIISPIILFVWLALVVALAALTAAFYATDRSVDRVKYAQTIQNVLYAIVGFQLWSSLDIFMSSLVLYRRLKSRGIQDIYARTILVFVSPATVMFAGYMLASRILKFTPPKSFVDTGYSLGYSIVFGVLNTFIVFTMVKIPGREVSALHVHEVKADPATGY